jgi:hypothetical protein
LRSIVRVEQSQRALSDLKDEFRRWLDRRQEADSKKQYSSQLVALGEVIEVVIHEIEGRLPEFARLPARTAYEECRAADRRAAFVRHLWSYFCDKWDQRDDPSLAPVLAAADEVVWSCYQPPFRHHNVTPGPAPLPHIGTDFSARAVRRIVPPNSVRASDELFRRVIDELPVPVIDLPHACVDEPWWLVLIAHEVGHQIAYAIEKREESPTIVELVGVAVAAAGLSPGQQARWRSWSHEIFADAYATATVGAAHLWALVELEQGTDATMVREVSGYPPPIVRHELVARLLDKIGLPPGEAIPEPPLPVEVESLDVPAEALAQSKELLATVPVVVAALVEAPLTEDATLIQLTGASAAQLGGSGDVGWWREQLAESEPAGPEAELDAARLATAGGIAEWAWIVEEENPARRSERAAALRRQLLAVLPESREPGYRDQGEDVAGDLSDLAVRVAAEVSALPSEEAWAPVVG